MPVFQGNFSVSLSVSTAGIRATINYTKIQLKKKNSFTINMAETRESRLKLMEETLKEIQNSMKNPVAVLEAISKVETEIKKVKKCFSDFQEEFKLLKEKQDSQEAEIRVIMDEDRKVKSEINNLRELLAKRKVWLDITGMPAEANENLKRVAEKVHAFCGVEISAPDIIDIFRKNKRNNDAPIVIKYADAEKRDLIKKAIRTKRLKSSKLGYKQNDKNIYANDCLSRRMSNLFWQVRKMKQDKKWNSVWTSRGKIYLKINQEDEPVNIKNEEDLLILIN